MPGSELKRGKSGKDEWQFPTYEGPMSRETDKDCMVLNGKGEG
jgi:hypothetical protein